MTFEHKPNTGLLFKNNKKESEKHPDYTGTALINGLPTRISGWKREGKNGTFLSLAFTAVAGEAQEPVRQGVKTREGDEDIPF